jgi:uncharacterized protein YggU (UPF0235/DUF167 family)
METLNVRFAEEDLKLIQDYATEKKISKAEAIRELVRLALRIESMKKDGNNNSNLEEEKLKKLNMEQATFAIESGYLIRAILTFLMGKDGTVDNKTAKEIRAQAIATAKTFVKTTMGIENEN